MSGRYDLSDKVDAQEVITAISQHELPPSVEPLLDTYESRIGDRPRFFWRWLDSLFPEITLSCVDPDHLEAVQEAKLLASMFVTVLDDIAEKHGDYPTFAEAAKVPFEHESSDTERQGVDSKIVAFIEELWDSFRDIPLGPRKEEFQRVLEFDLRQVITAINYSFMVNQNLNLLSERELWSYDVHNMAVFVYADLDLICSPVFDETQISGLREVVRHAERIARIWNWIMTWERELQEGDCTSGVIAYALQAGVISLEELEAIRMDPQEDRVRTVVDAIDEHGVEEHFHQRIREEFQAAEKWGRAVTSVDVEAYLDGFETVQAYHVAGRKAL